MKIPERLKIGGHWYEVKYPYHFLERDGMVGQQDWHLKEIRIGDTDGCGNQAAESRIAVTLIHEILHACDYITGHRMFEEKEGENKLEGLSEVLFQVLRDNDLNFRVNDED